MKKIIRFYIKKQLDIQIYYSVYCEYETEVGLFFKKTVIRNTQVFNDGKFGGGGTYTFFQEKSSALAFISNLKQIYNLK